MATGKTALTRLNQFQSLNPVLLVLQYSFISLAFFIENGSNLLLFLLYKSFQMPTGTKIVSDEICWSGTQQDDFNYVFNLVTR